MAHAFPPQTRVGYEADKAPTQDVVQGIPVFLGMPSSEAVQQSPLPASRGVVQGYRVDPRTAEQSDVPLLQGLPVQQAEKKLEFVHQGGEIAHSNPLFPSVRPYRDVFWAVPFAGVVVAMAAACVYFAQRIDIEHKVADDASHFPDIGSVVTAGACGGFASLGAAFLFVLLIRKYPACAVWTSLFFGPCLTIIGGIVMCMIGSVIVGGIFVMLGLLSLMWIFCYRHAIPFTIKLAEVIAVVMAKNPGMVGVSILGSLAGLVWSIVCGITFVGAALEYQDDLEDASRGMMLAINFVAVLILVWGGQVVHNVCHVTYCGVFGRWYCNVDDAAPLRRSLGVALTSSFGSICFGSFLIAAVRALEAIISQARRQQQDEGNILGCILLLVLECIISCIGDILEYFSEWAFVQCAVRGVSFIDAVKITFSMCTCANLTCILQDLLLNSVVNMGALLCAAVGCGAGAAAGFAFGQDATAIAGAVVGFVAGLMAGGSAIGVISSGAKTLLVLWAEDPEPLRRSSPDVHAEFERRIMANMCF